jgi:hypothetical protein
MAGVAPAGMDMASDAGTGAAIAGAGEPAGTAGTGIGAGVTCGLRRESRDVGGGVAGSPAHVVSHVLHLEMEPLSMARPHHAQALQGFSSIEPIIIICKEGQAGLWSCPFRKGPDEAAKFLEHAACSAFDML